MEARATELAAAAPEGGSIKLVNVLSATDGPARELLEGAGYVIDRHFWHMWLDLTGELAPPSVPAGFELREFDMERDQEAVHGVLTQAFAGHYGYPTTPTPFVEWQAQLGTPAYETGLWLVATRGDDVVAALTRRELLGEGWIQELGVLREHRGRGLGAALLTHAFHAFEAEGLRAAALNVDAANETGATALYERVGMKVRRQWDLYRKMLALSRSA
jgi:ribosomal protein S18 acetylase RimI-like enzyme